MDINNGQEVVPENQPGNRIILLTKWNKFHEYPPIGGLRHLVFFGQKTGFDKVIIRVGRRILIDEEAYFNWIRSNNQEVK